MQSMEKPLASPQLSGNRKWCISVWCVFVSNSWLFVQAEGQRSNVFVCWRSPTDVFTCLYWGFIQMLLYWRPVGRKQSCRLKQLHVVCTVCVSWLFTWSVLMLEHLEEANWAMLGWDSAYPVQQVKGMTWQLKDSGISKIIICDLLSTIDHSTPPMMCSSPEPMRWDVRRSILLVL